MKCKCVRCSVVKTISFKERMNILLQREKYMCDQCKSIKKYEEDYDFSSGISRYDSYSCCVGRYDKGLYEWWKSKVGLYCAVKSKSGEYFTAYLESFDYGRGVFRKKEVIRPFLIMEIDLLEIIKEGDSKYELTDSTMYGYKGLSILNGILHTSWYIYEISIPYVEERRDPLSTNYQDVYSHFCSSIEDVFSWRDCITTSVKNAENGTRYDEDRIFKVRAEGHCFRNTDTGWVTNSLTVIEEVTQKELVAYFEEHVDAREHVFSKLEKEKNMTDLWRRYKSASISVYKNLLSENEILEMCVKNSPSFGTEGCIAIANYKNCFICLKHTYCFERFMQNSFYYLIIRKRIEDGTFNTNCEEYRSLVIANAKKEVDSIHRLIQRKIN
ncbi:hypothetical protein psyc5s11_27250 [Clostridium gelidum]|uniref:Uncharacterized protein n=1 Tax=Clostridium gelidum TaxID=704125 RepID=A0ABN6J0G8_9CLOT|nr:hypothetical protein [Clostridium gelidum]BCZ46658.1 hypothetical protein psyc5s11_27250 [Clostridium gelidum]